MQKDDVIYRQAAIAVADYTDYTGLAIEDVKKVTDEVVKGLKQLPPAQPEIIKCGDCKHLQKWRSKKSAKKFGQIYECERDILICPLPDDFCSKGKRKE